MLHAMFHPFPGFSGIVLGAVVFVGVGLISYFSREHQHYNLDPEGKPGEFEPFLAKYLRVAEFIIGLAT